VVSPIRYCVNDPSTALTANGTNLLWYTVPTGGAGDPVAPTPLTTTAGTTIYYVSQTNGGCEGPRRPLSVIVNPLPIVSAGPDQQILAGQSITLQGSTSGNNVTVLWSPNQQLSSTTIRTPVASPRASITYTLTATSSDGCRASDEVNIVVLRELIIPNVFSPNGDGTNDRWIIKYIEDYPNAQVEIFNRYGQKLFERRGYSSANAWDGTYQGKPVPIGAYYYVLRPGEGRQVMSGSVSVIR
jgi:gliding motility-associated-like protein